MSAPVQVSERDRERARGVIGARRGISPERLALEFADVRAEGYAAGVIAERERVQAIIEQYRIAWPAGVSFVQDTKLHAANTVSAAIRARGGA